jgi:hypothetical protein
MYALVAACKRQQAPSKSFALQAPSLLQSLKGRMASRLSGTAFATACATHQQGRQARATADRQLMAYFDVWVKVALTFLGTLRLTALSSK